MIKVYTGKKGLAISLLFAIGAFVLMSFFFWGISAVIQFFLPLMVVLSYLLIIIFVLGILPSTFIKHLRPSLSDYSIKMSRALGISTGVMSFFIVIKAFGVFGVLFVFLFKYMAPIGFVGAMIKGKWHIVGHLAIWISFTYGMKYYSQWLLNLDSRRQDKGRIIEIDAIDVKGQST